MATNNKSLTTYLPDRSVEWLESYCLEYKHLQNKDGNPKLGTAIADIIARLADGELSLPIKIEPQSTLPIQYGTEVALLKGEVEELKKLINEYSTSRLPDTVLDLETVKHEIGTALEPVIESVTELEAYTQSQLASVRDELKALGGRSVTPDTIALATTKTATIRTKPENEPDWVNTDNRRFYTPLSGDSELLAKVTAAIELHPKDNKALAESLMSVGLHKVDGTALGSDSVSRIRKVVKNLNSSID